MKSPTHNAPEIKEYNTDISLVNSKSREDQNEVKKMTMEYLNEKLYYFYSHGGPIMKLEMVGNNKNNENGK